MSAPAAPATESEQLVDVVAYEDGKSARIDLRKAAPFGWWPAVIIALAAFIDRAEGAVTLGAAASLQEEFGFNDAFLGVLASAPIVAALIFVIPAGRLADRVKRKNMLVVVMCLWGICTLGAGAAVSLAMFTTFRILLGAATPLNIPPSSSLLGDFYPRRSRTKAFGILRSLENIGLPVGTLVGAVVGGLVGWRVAFFVVAVPALILAAVLFVTLREPRRGVGDEISALAQGAAKAGAAPAFPGAAGTTPPPPAPGMAPPPAPGSVAAGDLRVSGPRASSIVSGGPSASSPAVPAAPTPPAPPMPGATAQPRLEEPEFGPASMDAPAPGAPPAAPFKKLGVWATFRQVFRVKTVRRLVAGQTLLFAAFAGFFAFATLFFAREYFDDGNVFNVEGARIVAGEAQAIAGTLVAGLSIFAIGLAAVVADRIDSRFGTKRPIVRVDAALGALITGLIALIVFVVASPLALRLTAFLVFAGVNIIAVANLSAAIADTIPARFRGTGFSAFQFLLSLGSATGAALVGVGSAIAGDDLRYGFATLLIPLVIGVLVVYRARGSYLPDAEAVIAEAGARSGAAPAMH